MKDDLIMILSFLKDCAIVAMDCDRKTLASVDETGWVTVWNIEVNNQLIFSKKLQVCLAKSKNVHKCPLISTNVQNP